MAAKTVTFTVRKPDGTAWNGGVVKFDLLPGGYEAGGAQYPAHTITATAGSDGTGSVSLVRTAGFAGTDPKFRCTMPSGQQFTFSVPDSAASTDLSTLRAAG